VPFDCSLPSQLFLVPVPGKLFMNEPRLQTVVYGTFALCKSELTTLAPSRLTFGLHLAATSAFITGIHGILTNRQNYAYRSGAAGFNAGVTGATFFGE
jgi:hypothetical protein